MSSQLNSESQDTVDVPEYGVRSRSEMACSIHRDHDGDGHLPACRESQQDVEFTDVHIASHLPFNRWSLCQRPECFGDEVDDPKTRKTLAKYLQKMANYDIVHIDGEKRGRRYWLR